MLRRRVDELTTQLTEASNRLAPQDVEEFAQGEDAIHLNVQFPAGTESFKATWNEIAAAVLPQTFGGGADSKVIVNAVVSQLSTSGDGYSILPRSEYAKVINQMVVLGLIEARPHPILAGESLWFATPYGLTVGSRMVALKRKELPSS